MTPYELGIVAARVFGRRKPRPPDRDAVRGARTSRPRSTQGSGPPGSPWPPHPGGGAAGGPRRQGRGGSGPDGHRQDGRVPDRDLHAALRHPASAREASPRALIIAPTRELVVQIDATPGCSVASRPPSALVFGGVDYIKHENRSRRRRFLIGTPGRLIDYRSSARGRCRVEALILDEADRMFDMGFIADIRGSSVGCRRRGRSPSCSRPPCPSESELTYEF